MGVVLTFLKEKVKGSDDDLSTAVPCVYFSIRFSNIPFYCILLIRNSMVSRAVCRNIHF